MRVGMMLEREHGAAGNMKKNWHWVWLDHLKPHSPPPDTHFFQQGHTLQSFSNTAILWWLSIHMYEPVGGHSYSNHTTTSQHSFCSKLTCGSALWHGCYPRTSLRTLIVYSVSILLILANTAVTGVYHQSWFVHCWWSNSELCAC